MFKRHLAVVAAAASLLITTSPAAVAGMTSYEDPAIEVHVNPTTLVGGNSFDGFATSGDLECEWSAEFRGDTETDSGTDFSFEFDTPEVSDETTSDVTITCVYDDTLLVAPEFGVEASILPTALQQLDRVVRITMLPQADDDDDDDDDSAAGGGAARDLPDAGGPDAAWILGGTALLLMGAATLVVVRRRNA